ncbi:MAG: tetratricopeptide repeat protein [Candidatus Margulisiibacteriota bacterium]
MRVDRFKQLVLIVMLLGFTVLGASSVFAMGEPPKPETPTAPQEAFAPDPTTPTASVGTANAKLQELTQDDIRDIRQAYDDAMKQKQYSVALTTLSKLPDKALTPGLKSAKTTLTLFGTIEAEASANASIFRKDDTLDEDTKRTVSKLYKEAQSAYLNGQQDIARDLLIHILFLDRQNANAKKFLELGLNLPLGTYKVENMEAKYWNLSSVHFYGGNYNSAVQDLNILTIINKDDSRIYERMGSAYYMMGEKSKAVDIWNTALFLNPTNKDLAQIIDRAKQSIKDDEAQAKLLDNNRVQKQTKIAPQDLQLMGTFPSQEKAYNFAQQMKQQGFANPIVEEQDNGKWTVSVPKKK